MPPATLLKPSDLPACSLVNSAALSMETNEFPGLCRSSQLGSKTDYSVMPSLPLFYFGIFEHLFCRSSPLIWCPKIFIPGKVHMQLKYGDLQLMAIAHSKPFPWRQMPKTDSLKHIFERCNCIKEKKINKKRH